MLPATKRLKLSSIENKASDLCDAESGFVDSQVDYSTENYSDLPQGRRKGSISSCIASHRGSYKQQSFSESHQLSSGYGSYVSPSFSLTGSSSTNVSQCALALVSPLKTRKRKSEINTSDENFYNSFQFVSPAKKGRKRDPSDKNCAKLILKEKSSSENVIQTSTPIKTEQRANKWGKFRTFHPEKLNFGDSILPAKSASNSLNFSGSFNLSQADISQHIPEHVQNLWTGDIKIESGTSAKTQQGHKVETITHEAGKASTRTFYNGVEKFDILGKLYTSQDIAVTSILNNLNDSSLLRLSHVSKAYRQMITSNKNYETKRQNYLKYHKANLENKYPAVARKQRTSSILVEKRAFGEVSSNQIFLRHKPSTPPQSPSRRSARCDQKSLVSKKCPRCSKPAVVKTIRIRNSPRKSHKKNMGNSLHILELSPAGRISKRSSKTPRNKNCQTLPLTFDIVEERSSSSSGCESPGHSSGSEDCNDEIYEFAECTALGCSFKFCVKCNCKYHPRFKCGELSPPSPSRAPKVAAACTKSSLKSLKRLFNN